MATIRQKNWLGNQRVDVPHLREIESAVAGDFDLLAGRIMAGQQALIVNGFEVVLTPSPIGSQATLLQLSTANASVMNPLASESGTIFTVPANRAVEVLNTSNTRLTGSFTASSINYVAIDLRRSADTTTTDLVQFLNSLTNLETPKQVPLARTLDYVIIVSTQDFNTTPGLAPVAKITTDSNNNVTAVEDARNRPFRLGTGGSITQPKFAYPWAGGRGEAGNNSDYGVGDKVINSLREWMQASMTRAWELGGGEYWYSTTADRNVRMVRTGTPYANGDNFTWSGTDLNWKGIGFVFDDSTVNLNEVADQTSNSPGLTDLADGQCIYVDLDRSTSHTRGGATALVAQKATLLTMGAPTIPGSRWIIAWRTGTAVFSRDSAFVVGTTAATATTSSLGIVQLGDTPPNPATPLVATYGTNGSLIHVATAGNTAGGAFTGLGSGAGLTGTGGATNGTGLQGTGTGTGIGGSFTGGSGGGNAIVGNENSNATNSQLVLRDTAGNAHAVFDHLGFYMGQMGAIDEEWLGVPATFAGANTLTGISQLGNRWSHTAHTTATINTSNQPTTAYSGSNCSLTPGTNPGSGCSIATSVQLFDYSSTFNCVVAEWDQMGITGSNTNAMIFSGFSQYTVPSGSAGPNPARGTLFGFYIRPAVTQWDVYTDTNIGSVGSTTLVTPDITSTYRFRVEMYGSGSKLGAFTVKYYVNGSLVGTHTPTAPNSGALMTFTFGVGVTTGNLTTAVNKVGGIKIRWHRAANSLPITI